MHEFKPDWCMAPSETLREWFREAGSVVPDSIMIREVLERKPLTSEHAGMLEACTGVTAQFWLNLERNYREGLAAGLTDASDT